MKISGKTWKFGDNINTDIIMPASVEFGQFEPEGDFACKQAMNGIRPGWSENIKKGDIIIAGKNFGCGSGRCAPRVIKALGINIIIAESIARQFFRNAINIGFPVLTCQGITKNFEEGELLEVDIEEGIVTSLTSGKTIKGEPIKKGSPPDQILQIGGIEKLIRKEVTGIKPIKIDDNLIG